MVLKIKHVHEEHASLPKPKTFKNNATLQLVYIIILHFPWNSHFYCREKFIEIRIYPNTLHLYSYNEPNRI